MSRGLIAIILAGALAGAGAFAARRGTRVTYEGEVATETSARTAEVCSCCAPK
jgi:hypothetical protein